MDDFTIAAAQSQSFAGSVLQNVAHHAAIVFFAAKQNVKVVVFPELSLTGYEPSLAADTAIDSHDPMLKPLQDVSNDTDVTIIAGCPIRSSESKPYIGALIIRPQRSIKSYRKRFLHTGEEQHFVPGDDVVVCESHRNLLGIAVCADINNASHPFDVANNNATIYAAGVAMTPSGIDEAERNMATYAHRYGLLTVLANYATPTGGFQMAGKSAIWDETGRLVVQADSKGESLALAEATAQGWQGKVVSCCSI